MLGDYKRSCGFTPLLVIIPPSYYRT
jgi:hypothetical protein